MTMRRLNLLLARGTARFDDMLARGTARFDDMLARGTARFDDMLTRGTARFDIKYALGLWVLALAFTGCASRAAFDTTFPVGRQEQLNAVLARIAGASRPAQTPVVVGVTGGSDQARGIFAYDLSAQKLSFSTQAPVDGLPIAAGSFVVVPEGDTVRVRALASGSVLHEIDSDDMHLIGADSDGDVTAIVLSTGGSYGASSLLVILRGGSVVRRMRVERPLGAPAVLGGLVFVPHSRVHLSVITPEGEELMRLAVRDDVASQALTDGKHVFFGLAGLYLLDGHTQSGVKGGAHYFAPPPANRRKLPGGPSFMRDTADKPPAVDSAVHRIALSFAPASSGSDVGVADHSLYLSFYRLLFSLTDSADNARWVRSTPTDLVGVQAFPGGVAVVEESGTVSAFDAEGRALFTHAMGVTPVVANIRAEGIVASGGGEPPEPLIKQLVAAALHTDTRLVPAGELAVRLLGAMPDAEATETLITICGQADAPRRLRDGACEALGTRTQGNDAILAALAKRSDFLADLTVPPLTPLAKAAAAANETRATPLLLDHLEDPATPGEDLPAIAAALLKLADASAAPRVERFLRLYHADASEPGLSEALVSCAALLGKLNKAGAQPVLEGVANDPRTESALREAVGKQVVAMGMVGDDGKGDGQARGSVGEKVDPNAPPTHLTQEHLTQALAPVQAQVTQCVRNDPAHPISARLTVVVEAGKVASVQTLPASLQPCVEPLVRRITLPATRTAKRETLHHTISH
jgi:hypothetical protein